MSSSLAKMPIRWKIWERFNRPQARDASSAASEPDVSSASDGLSVTLEARRYPQIGCTLMHIAGKALMIATIDRVGRIPAWNQEHPDRRIRIGDCIVDVDGICEDSRRMSQQIRRAHNVVELRLQPRARMILDADVRSALQALMQSRGSSLRVDDLELVAMFDYNDARTEETQNPNDKIDMLVKALPRIRASDCYEDACAVCLVDFTPDALLSRLPCGHCYCTKCISQWLTQHQSHCPLCLKSIIVEPCIDSDPDAASLDECMLLGPLAKLYATSLGVTRCKDFSRPYRDLIRPLLSL